MTVFVPAKARDEPRRATGFNWPLLVAVWLGVVAIFSIRWHFQSGTEALISGNDDAMRLVVVRDFMNGQGWWDHIQHRLNTPYGAEIHWSRIVDVPIAFLIEFFRVFVDRARAEVAAVYVWPLVLLFGLLALTMRLTTRLVGQAGALPGLVLPVFSMAIMTEFAPGRIDHHSVQTLFALVLVLGTIEAWTKPRWAIVAGIAGGIGLAVGTEGLPFIVAAILAYGLYWSADPGRAPTMRAFGIAFGSAALAALAIQLPPDRWLEPACDAMSITYAAAGAGVGLVFAVLSILPLARRGWQVRLGVGVLFGGLLLAGLLALFPECLGGPYAALDPWLKTVWLDRIQEAKPIWQALADAPAFIFAIAFPPILALPVIALRVWRGGGENRVEWMINALFLAFAVAVMLVEIRGARLAAAFAVPAGAWLITATRGRYVRMGRIRHALGLVGSWLAFCGIALVLVVNLVLMLPGVGGGTAQAHLLSTDASAEARRACRMPGAYAQLAHLPAARVMSAIDIGAPILAYTHHSVVGAPYHRNQAGLIDTINFFNRPLDSVRDILRTRGITLVVTCAALPEMQGGFDPDKGSFVRLAQKGELPAWVHRISKKGAVLQIYRVTP